MIQFVFNEANTRFLFLRGETNEDQTNLIRLKNYLNLVDPICYLKTFSGIPFTQDFLYEYRQQTGKTIYYCSIGLWQVVYKFFKENNIEYTGLTSHTNFFKHNIKHTFDEFCDVVRSWNLQYEPRPYQYTAAYNILQWKRSTSQLATRAGKTLINYMVFRYAMEYMGVHNILMIVPSIDLVKQAYNDFADYAEFFNTECVWGGGKLVESSNLTVGTFQSLIKFFDKKSKKYNPSFFDKFDLVCVDETHRATAQQIKDIISHKFMENVKIAFGVTGTLPPEHTIDNYCVHALLGAKIQDVSPKQLMDEGYISKVHINQIRLEHKPDIDLAIRCAEYMLSSYIMEPNPKDPKKKRKVPLKEPKFLIRHAKELPNGLSLVKAELKNRYKDDNTFKSAYMKVLLDTIKASDTSNFLNLEKMMLHFSDRRIDYLCNNILPRCYRNTLILAHHTEYINYFADIIKKRFPNRHIAVITGSVSPKKRDEIKQMLKDNDDCILIASFGCMSTGITLSNLFFGVFFESFKSTIVNMQSIGRGLQKTNLKDKYVLFDIIDKFDKSVSKQKLFLQGLAKLKIYDNESFPYSVETVKL